MKKSNQNGLATVFHYSPNGELLWENDQAGNTRAYVWLNGRPLARIDNNAQIYYYHVDHLGTPQAMTDATGATVWKADYEPFGKATVKVATVENNLRFPGQYYDRETGLHYNYFRDYEPGTGRYVQSDPIGLAGGLNTYAYVRNNPALYSDPLGLDINVCYYPDGITHIGFGAVGESSTFGFYPNRRAPIWPGEVRQDPKNEPRECKVIPSDSEQDRCMKNCRLRRTINPGWYHLTQRQCTSFVRDCMRECGIPTGIAPSLDPWQGPKPENFYRALPGTPTLHE